MLHHLNQAILNHFNQEILKILNKFKKQQKDEYILTAAHLDFVTPLLNSFDIHHHFADVSAGDF